MKSQKYQKTTINRTKSLFFAVDFEKLELIRIFLVKTTLKGAMFARGEPLPRLPARLSICFFFALVFKQHRIAVVGAEP